MDAGTEYADPGDPRCSKRSISEYEATEYEGMFPAFPSVSDLDKSYKMVNDFFVEMSGNKHSYAFETSEIVPISSYSYTFQSKAKPCCDTTRCKGLTTKRTLQ